MTKKTYCIFSANYIPNTGGVEKYTQNLAVALAERGNHVVIVTNNVFDLDEHEELAPGIEIIRLPCNKLLKGRYPVSLKNEPAQALWLWLYEQDIDHVIVNTRFYTLSMAGIEFAENKGIKPIIIDHGSAHLTMGNKLVDVFVSSYEHRLTARVKKHPADYYAVSSSGVDWLTHFDIQAKGVLSNAIDAQKFRELSSRRDFRKEIGLSAEDFLIVFVGRLIPEKGISSLIDAATILKDNSSIHFALAGDGPLAETVRGKGLPNVHLLGKLDAVDISALFETADIHCLPSRSEGFATTLLEASAWGTVSVVTDVGGVAELIPTSEYGVVIKNASGQTIAQAIEELFEDRAYCESIGARVQQRVDTLFSWDDTAAKVEIACSGTDEA